MSLAKEIWDKLSKIDVNNKTEKKGQFTYLSWSWAWAEFSKHYPECDYTMSEKSFEDGTMEVHCYMTVYQGDEKVNRFMWLPITNFNNKAIPKPNSFDINTGRMRCLVKCLAMYGLGHYIYAGEDIPRDSDESTLATNSVVEKPWYSDDDFDNMKHIMIERIIKNESTGIDIVKKLQDTYRVSKKMAAQIEALS